MQTALPVGVDVKVEDNVLTVERQTEDRKIPRSTG